VIVESSWLLTGDIGGTGITRFRWALVGFGAPSAADCSSALSNQHTLLSGFSSAIPAAVTWTPQAEHRALDPGSGLVNSFINASAVPAAITGSNSSDYAAGIGARIQWRTSTVLNRRLMKSASFIVPLAGSAFTLDGSIAPAISGAGTTLADAYLTAMQGNGLAAVAWHRPAKGTTSGGEAAAITSGTVGPTPSGLRSRRS